MPGDDGAARQPRAAMGAVRRLQHAHHHLLAARVRQGRAGDAKPDHGERVHIHHRERAEVPDGDTAAGGKDAAGQGPREEGQVKLNRSS